MRAVVAAVAAFVIAAVDVVNVVDGHRASFKAIGAIGPPARHT